MRLSNRSSSRRNHPVQDSSSPSSRGVPTSKSSLTPNSSRRNSTRRKKKHDIEDVSLASSLFFSLPSYKEGFITVVDGENDGEEYHYDTHFEPEQEQEFFENRDQPRQEIGRDDDTTGIDVNIQNGGSATKNDMQRENIPELKSSKNDVCLAGVLDVIAFPEEHVTCPNRYQPDDQIESRCFALPEGGEQKFQKATSNLLLCHQDTICLPIDYNDRDSVDAQEEDRKDSPKRKMIRTRTLTSLPGSPPSSPPSVNSARKSTTRTSTASKSTKWKTKRKWFFGRRKKETRLSKQVEIREIRTSGESSADANEERFSKQQAPRRKEFPQSDESLINQSSNKTNPENKASDKQIGTTATTGQKKNSTEDENCDVFENTMDILAFPEKHISCAPVDGSVSTNYAVASNSGDENVAKGYATKASSDGSQGAVPKHVEIRNHANQDMFDTVCEAFEEAICKVTLKRNQASTSSTSQLVDDAAKDDNDVGCYSSISCSGLRCTEELMKRPNQIDLDESKKSIVMPGDQKVSSDFKSSSRGKSKVPTPSSTVRTEKKDRRQSMTKSLFGKRPMEKKTAKPKKKSGKVGKENPNGNKRRGRPRTKSKKTSGEHRRAKSVGRSRPNDKSSMKPKRSSGMKTNENPHQKGKRNSMKASELQLRRTNTQASI